MGGKKCTTQKAHSEPRDEKMNAEQEATGIAALSVCESLLIALIEREVLGAEEVQGLLEDAAAAHLSLDVPLRQKQQHEAVARIIEHLFTRISAARPTKSEQF
jgi:hypothetical protein